MSGDEMCYEEKIKQDKRKTECKMNGESRIDSLIIQQMVRLERKWGNHITSSLNGTDRSQRVGRN